MRHLTAIIAILWCCVGAAHAFSDVPGHVDIKVKAKTKTINGVKTKVGCTVTFACQNPRGSYATSYVGAKRTRPTLWTPEVARTLGEADRRATHDEEPFKARGGTIFGDFVEVPDQGVVVPGTIEIDYATHGVTSGQRLTLITGWNYGSNVHVYGGVTNYSEGNEFVLP